MVTTSVVTSQIQDYLHLSKLEFALGSKCFQVMLMVKNPPTNAGDPGDLGLIPGREDPLEEVMATHPSIALRIPWTEEPGRLQSFGSQRVEHD